MRNSRGKHSFIQFYPDQWVAGTARMPRLVQSVYFQICLFNWDKARPVPAATLRLMLSDLDRRQADDIIGALIEEGSLVLNGDGSIEQPRAMAEARKAFEAWAAKSRGGKAARGVEDDKTDAAMMEDTSKTAPQKEREIEKEIETSSDEEGSAVAEQVVLGPADVVDAWNEVARLCGLSQVQKMTEERKKRLKARIEEHGAEAIIEGIKTIPENPFFRGENDRGWKASFDWLLSPKYCVKLIEGGYERGRGKGSAWLA